MSIASSASIPIDFSFPLRPDVNKSSNSASFNRPKHQSFHSRQYTGIEIPVPIKASDLSTSSSFPEFPMTPPELVSSKPRSPHKKHAHRRSAAISCDLSALVSKPPSPDSLHSLDLPTVQFNEPSLKNSLCSSPYSMQSPALTIASNSSHSLPMQSSESLSSAESDIEDPPKRRHSKMLSWTSSLFSRKDKKNSVATTVSTVLPDSPRSSEDSITSLSNKSNIASSVYGSTQLYPDTCIIAPLDVPLIDLDAALIPFSISQESRFKRRPSDIEPTIFEEEEESPSTTPDMNLQQAATLSNSSLPSTINSASNINSSRSRFPRNYGSFSLAAPNALSSNASLLSSSIKEEGLSGSKTLKVEDVSIDPLYSLTPPLTSTKNTVEDNRLSSCTITPTESISDTVEVTSASVAAKQSFQSFRSRSSRLSRIPHARFSVSSLSSLASSRSSRFMNWVKGKRSNSKA